MWLIEIWGFVVNGSEEREDGENGNNGLWRMGFSVFEVHCSRGQESKVKVLAGRLWGRTPSMPLSELLLARKEQCLALRGFLLSSLQSLSPSYWHPPSPCVTMSSTFLLLIKTLCTGFRAHPIPGSSHLEIHILITFAKTLVPNKVTFWGCR